MMRRLIGALACLACLTTAYANEFYEVGVRHGTDKARSARQQRCETRCCPRSPG
jgi:hypothetical protein